MKKDDIINRRDFFKFGFKKSGNIVGKQIQKKVPRIGVRPPGAVDEDEFLLLCSRCTDCINACPHDVIFKPSFAETKIYGETPFLDLKHKACEFCVDFPCISACTKGALVKTEETPVIGTAKVYKEHCLGAQGQYCDYCSRSCPKEFNALTIGEDRVPIIDETACVGCGKCEYICPSQTGKAIEIRWITPK
ncbi:MAG: 4Fe-4S dicluster domain-containing protein [Flavobacteriales bacterium]|nr:4Fe-4S dicluster domain-containing protein [Flavobacteriales bacterium]